MAEQRMSLPVVRHFTQTGRRDLWWAQPLAVFVGLSAFVVYSTWAAFQGEHYSFGPYLSPFYSPELFGDVNGEWEEGACTGRARSRGRVDERLVAVPEHADRGSRGQDARDATHGPAPGDPYCAPPVAGSLHGCVFVDATLRLLWDKELRPFSTIVATR